MQDFTKGLRDMKSVFDRLLGDAAPKEKTMYTPGPWEVDSGMVQTADGIPIAHMDRTPGNGTMPTERDSNAHLTAAGPQMYEVLRDIIEYDSDVEKCGIPVALLEKATAAIRKAQGRK